MGLGYFRRLRSLGRLTLRQRAACALAAALCVLFSSEPALAENQPVVATGEAEAAILQPGSLIHTADMDFGWIAQPQAPGTVSMTATATPTCTGSVGIVQTGACQPAEFALQKRSNGSNPVRIRAITTTIVLTNTNGDGATMTVDNLKIGLSGLSNAPGGIPTGSMGRYKFTSPTGIATFRIAGTLHVGALQDGGLYTGQFQIEAIFE